MKGLVKEINEITERYDRMYTATIYGSVEGARHQQECDFERLVYLVKKMNYIPFCETLPDVKEIIHFAKAESDRLEKSKHTNLDKKGYMFGIMDGARYIKDKLKK